MKTDTAQQIALLIGTLVPVIAGITALYTARNSRRQIDEARRSGDESAKAELRRDLMADRDYLHQRWRDCEDRLAKAARPGRRLIRKRPKE